MSIKPGQKGFTLIELLVVIAIIGVLSSIIFVSTGTQREKARNIVRISDLKTIGTAMELYYSDHGSYPAFVGFGADCSLAYGSVFNSNIGNPTWDSAIGASLLPYIKIPRPPSVWFPYIIETPCAHIATIDNSGNILKCYASYDGYVILTVLEGYSQDAQNRMKNDSGLRDDQLDIEGGIWNEVPLSVCTS